MRGGGQVSIITVIVIVKKWLLSFSEFIYYRFIKWFI